MTCESREEKAASRENSGPGRIPGAAVLRQLREWSPRRLVYAGAATAGAAAALLSTEGILNPALWWNAVFAVVGSVLAGLLIGSYFRAPAGAAATVCDTRWPLLGLLVLAAATAGPEGPLGYLFGSISPALLTGIVSPAFALLSLALLGWALWSRLKLERQALTPEAEPNLVCTTCRPLFPSQTGTGRS
ncbi:hypothetical protein ACWGQ2_17420 [Arthrobacter sp. NPDC055585]